MPAVSILIPVYNSSRFLAEMLDSVKAQTFTDQELVMVADPCTDNSLEIINKYKNSLPIKLICNSKRAGLPGSLNIGLKQCQGKYILRLDTDDLLTPDCLAKMYTFVSTQNVDGVICDELKIDEHGKPKYMLLKLLEDYYIKKQNLFRTAYGGPSTLLKKEKFSEAGGYDDRLDISDDKRLALKLHRITKLGHIPERLYLYREHGGNMSQGIGKKLRSKEYQTIMAEYATFTKKDYINNPEKIEHFKTINCDHKSERTLKYANVILRCALELAKLGDKPAALAELDKAAKLYPKTNFSVFKYFIQLGFKNYLDKLYVNMNAWTIYAYDDFHLVNP